VGPGDGCAFGVVCFLPPAQVDFVASPEEPVLPGDRVAGRSILHAGSVRVDGEPWSAGPFGFVTLGRSVVAGKRVL